jgi:hypothetical protein
MLLALVVSAIGDVCVYGCLHHHVVSASGARGGVACDRGAIPGSVTLNVV